MDKTISRVADNSKTIGWSWFFKTEITVLFKIYRGDTLLTSSMHQAQNICFVPSSSSKMHFCKREASLSLAMYSRIFHASLILLNTRVSMVNPEPLILGKMQSVTSLNLKKQTPMFLFQMRELSYLYNVKV